jgi:small subunit ribosomal protein S6
MPKSAPLYDLMVLLSTSADDGARQKILADVEKAIADGGGTIELKQDWGIRSLAYEIVHTGDAEYHLLQFSGPPALVEALGYNLKITDGVLRHRIIKVLPGTPPAPEPSAAAPPAETAAGAGAGAESEPAEAIEAEAAAPAEAPAAEAPAAEAPESAEAPASAS